MWYFVISITLIVLIGFAKQLYDTNQIFKDYEKVQEYFDKLIEEIKFISLNKKLDNKLYSELIAKSTEIQLLIGFNGVIDLEEYGRMYSNYPLVLNTIPKLKELITENNSFGIENLCKEVDMLQNGFLRYFNDLENIMNKYKKKIFNPFICLREGMLFILSFPFNVLYWIGLLNEKNKTKIEKGIIIKVLSGIVSLITLLSTIMSIVVGWDEFIKIIESIFLL